jgi:CelD/BcsL family acetyltransferase involved in cellulose biosynthesis
VSQEAPFADLALRVAPDGPSLAYPPRDRSSYRRRLRRLAERGEIAFLSVAAGKQARALAEQAVAMKRDALAQHGVVAPTVADPRFARFFAALASDTGDEAGLRLSVIACDGRPIGIDLSFDCKDRSFGHVIASDPAFEREGLGRVLVHHAFACARDRGSSIFDLLAPADPYKQEHADGAVPVRDFTVPLSWRGQLACDLALPHLRPTLKAIAKRLPAGWVRRFAAPG